MYSFGIDEQSETAKNFRLNVIHMRGVENMNTKDIFKYFEDYAPASIEWINEISCKYNNLIHILPLINYKL